MRTIGRPRGAISTEYTIILVLVAVGVIIAFMLLGTTLRQQAGTSVDKIGGRENTYASANRVDAAVDRMRAAEVTMSQGDGGGGAGTSAGGEGGEPGDDPPGDDMPPATGQEPATSLEFDTGGTPPPAITPAPNPIVVTFAFFRYWTWRTYHHVGGFF